MGAVLNSCRVLYLDDNAYRKVAEQSIVRDERQQLQMAEDLQFKINGLKLRIQTLHKNGQLRAAKAVTRLLILSESRRALSENIVTSYEVMRSNTDARAALRNTAVALKEYKTNSTALGLTEKSIEEDGAVLENAMEQVSNVNRSLDEVGQAVEPLMAEIAGADDNELNARMMEIVRGSDNTSALENKPLQTDPDLKADTAAVAVVNEASSSSSLVPERQKVTPHMERSDTARATPDNVQQPAQSIPLMLLQI